MGTSNVFRQKVVVNINRRVDDVHIRQVERTVPDIRICRSVVDLERFLVLRGSIRGDGLIISLCQRVVEDVESEDNGLRYGFLRLLRVKGKDRNKVQDEENVNGKVNYIIKIIF